MMFEFSQLRCFVAVGEELHFGRAAQRLNMTQPPLSRQIQSLERILGVVLLERTSRSVRLTTAGRAFLIESQRILRLANSAALTTRRIAGGDAGRVAIGFTAASGYSFLPSLVNLARTRLPDVDLTLRELVSGDQVEALVTGRIDLGLARPPLTRPEFDKIRVMSEPLVAALPVGDPRLEKEIIELTDFDRQPLVMYSPEGASYFHDMLAAMFDAADVSPDFVQHMSQIHSILSLVHARLGAAVVPAAAMQLHFDGVEFRPLRTIPAEPVELFVAWRRDNQNPGLQPLLDLIEEEVGAGRI
jgi:DNA-binding transcriptional LysR family regulator